MKRTAKKEKKENEKREREWERVRDRERKEQEKEIKKTKLNKENYGEIQKEVQEKIADTTCLSCSNEATDYNYCKEFVAHIVGI